MRNLITLTQSLSGEEQPETVVRRALDYALSALEEGAGLALVRTSFGALRVVARQGFTPEGEAAAGRWCGPGSPVLHSIEKGQCRLFAVEDRTAPTVGLPMPDEDVRFLAVIPFLALGKSLGGMALFLHREPDKLLWDDALPYIGAAAGLALAQSRLKETIETQGRMASLGRVAAWTAHELRNPLTVMGATLELLHRDLQLDMEARMRLDRAQDAFRRVVRLIDELSGYSKPTRPVAERFPLSDLFAAVLDLLGPEAGSREIKISVSTTPASLAVRGDRIQLLEVLINLVENAIDAIERQGRIALQAEPRNGTVQLAVRDSGPGMDPELLERIFDPFFTTKAHRTGLGLTIVREIVERFGGTIRVESQLGAGTEFFVTFPAD
jgi:signal transduction histidine kinase